MSRRLGVAFFTNSIAIGGMEKHVVELASALAKMNCDVCAIAPGTKEVSPFLDWLREAGIPTYAIDLRGDQPKRQLVSEARRLRRLLIDRRVDIFHQHRTGPYHGKWACLVARTAGARVVATEHLPAFRLSGVSRRINALADRVVDRLVTVCDLDRARQLSVTWRDPRKVVTIHNGIDISRFTQSQELRQRVRAMLGLPDDVPVIGVLARLSPEKGITHLLKALVPLTREHRNLVVLIAGDGPLRGALEAEAALLGVAPHIRFLGYWDKAAELLGAIDLLALPSEAESFPIVLLEAMAMSRPAVACNVGGVSEAVLDGVSGYVVPPKDPRALEVAIDRCLRNGQLVAMGAAARKRVEGLFTADVMARKTEALYRGLLPG